MGVGPGSVPAGGQHGERKDDHGHPPHRGLRIRDLPLFFGLGIGGSVAGVGLLYLLRNAGIAGAGPSLAGSLPLEQLAGSDAQPLVRVLLAWLPVGIAVGALVATIGRSAASMALAAIGFVATLVLVVSAAVCDAIANNDRVTSHLAAPLGDAGTWTAVVALLIGAAAGAGLAARRARAPSAR